MKRLEDTLDRLDTYLKFEARQMQLKQHVQERTDWKCDYCGKVETEWAVMIHHLLENHEEKFDWDEMDQELNELLRE